MAISAYVLIQTEVGKAAHVATSVRAISASWPPTTSPVPTT